MLLGAYYSHNAMYLKLQEEDVLRYESTTITQGSLRSLKWSFIVHFKRIFTSCISYENVDIIPLLNNKYKLKTSGESVENSCLKFFNGCMLIFRYSSKQMCIFIVIKRTLLSYSTSGRVWEIIFYETMCNIFKEFFNTFVCIKTAFNLIIDLLL